jgi:hypothetical protein
MAMKTKILVLVVGILFAGNVVQAAKKTADFSVQTAETTSQTTNFVSEVSEVSNGVTLKLVPSQTEIKPGDSINVDIILDTQGVNVDGVDIFALHFDPQVFSAEMIAGSIMEITAYNKTDNTAGTIKFSQIPTLGTSYNGSGVLATVVLTAKTAGSSSLNFDFVPGSTVDANVASQGQDVLASVNSAEFLVSF